MRKNYFLVLLAILLTANGIAQNIPSYVPTNGLVGYWPFNGNANDESGNGNHGTVNGASLTEGNDGKTNSAFNFLQNQYIEIKSLNQNNINGYTISAWFKKSMNNSNTDGAILSGSYPGQSPGGLRLTIGTINRFQWQVEDYPGINGILQMSPGDKKNYCDDNWHSVVSTFSSPNGLISSSSFKIYVDGSLVETISTHSNWPTLDTTTYAPINNGNRNIIIGNSGDNYSNSFLGSLEDIGIWNRALTEKEITALYTSCTSETATSSNFNSLLLSTSSSVSLSAEPQGGVFTGASIDSNKFIPSKAKIGANKVQYNFKNSQGCNDSTLFTMIVADTVGTTCKKYDTITVTNSVTKYDTVTVTNNVTKYDTVIVPKTVTKYDTVLVNKYDTITVTNNVTKYDTVIVPKTVTKYDTVKINTYDTITVTNNVTKYDTVIVPKTITKYDTVKVNTYDTITVTNTVTKYDTVMVNKYDTITVADTVNILKINFKLTTGIKANQMTSMSIYPNPTSDVLIIDASDLAAIAGYSYRILDVLGKEVYNALVTAAKTEISLKTLGAKGMYVLHILDANKLSVQTKQIVLE